MSKHTKIQPGESTQVTHPWRSVLRTLIASAVGAILAWTARTFGIDLTGFSTEMVDSLTAFVWAAGTSMAQWALTRQGVESWLIKYAPWFATGVHTELQADPIDID